MSAVSRAIKGHANKLEDELFAMRVERMKAHARIRDLETQVEVKDVALTRIVNECSRFPIKDGLAFRVESIALNALSAPARETE